MDTEARQHPLPHRGRARLELEARWDFESDGNAIELFLDTLDELGETESLRLQMAMDRESKFLSTLSNILKKISDTADSITDNIK